MTTKSSELGDAALSFVASGRYVFPCLPEAKRPATKNGLHAATLDPAVVEKWWTQEPAMNVAVACGPSNLLVVDMDEKPPVSGVANFFALADAFGDADSIATRTHETPSGGGHLIFELPDERVGNSAGKLAPGVDTRGAGGYAVLPPSRLPAGQYRVYDDTAVLPAPRWLLERLTEPTTPVPTPAPGRRAGRYGQAALDAELGRVAVATAGTRNDTLVRAAFRLGQLAAAGELDPAGAAEALHHVAARIGLSDHEIERTIVSGMRAGAAAPRKPTP